MLFDYQGKQISFSVPLFLNELQGYRIKVYNESSSSAHKVDLRFSLIDPTMSHASLRDIYIQRIIADGNLLWGADGILLCSAPDIQETPKMTPDGTGNFII